MNMSTEGDRESHNKGHSDNGITTTQWRWPRTTLVTPENCINY